MRVRAVVSYDGTGYGGFQRQRNAPTIQAELETALEQLTQTPTRVLAAGRTDAGVHAEGQVIAFDTAWERPLVALQRGMNALLPLAVAVRELVPAPENFHPRYAARSRWYRYTLYRAAERNPLMSRYSLHVPQALDLDVMQTAAAQLVGIHDFAAFGMPPQGESTVREVIRAVWTAQESCWYFDIEANAFLYRMVRLLVGTLLRVGAGKLSFETFTACLQSRERRHVGPAVSPTGLVLKAVAYPAMPKEELARLCEGSEDRK